MAKTFKLEIVTPDGTAWKGEATALQVPSWEGYLGVLAGHAPLLCVLRAGVLTIRDAGERSRTFALKGGFMDVSGGRAVVLADAIEPAEQVDVKATEEALEALNAPLPPMPPAGPGEDDAQRRAAHRVAVEEREAARLWNEARLLAADRLAGRGAA